MTAVIILDEAERDLARTVAYYEARKPGLGSRFRNEVGRVVNRILQDPQLPRLRAKGYRRVNLRAFPHYVSYVIRGEMIWIIAIAHGHRRPEFWLDPD